MTKYVQNAPETVLQIRKIQVLSKKWAKSQTKFVLFFTKYSIFIVGLTTGRLILCTKEGERETRQKSISLPLKAGELASLLCPINVQMIYSTNQSGLHIIIDYTNYSIYTALYLNSQF